jgi:predicted nucleotidyltransferase component of viral defense system
MFKSVLTWGPLQDPKATWPSFKIKIGYAYKHEPKKYRRLMNKDSSDIIKIDYSLNEVILDTELFELSDGEYIFTYSYADLISEKFRAILQQEARNRSRGQDVYDLYYILLNFGEPDDKLKEKILNAIKEKSISRKLDINHTSMASPEIKNRSQKKYASLELNIYEELPPFEETYSTVQKFYESLPWK